MSFSVTSRYLSGLVLPRYARCRRLCPTSLSNPRREEFIVRILLEVLGQLVDARGEQRDLHLGRAGVAIVPVELAHEFLFLLHWHGHDFCVLSFPAGLPTGSNPPPGGLVRRADYTRTQAGSRYNSAHDPPADSLRLWFGPDYGDRHAPPGALSPGNPAFAGGLDGSTRIRWNSGFAFS